MKLSGLLLMLLSSSAILCDGMVGRTMRRSILSYQNNQCACCRRHFSTYVPSEIHHLNHNRTDHSRLNLVALCANCHGAHHRNGVPVGPYLPAYKGELIWKEAERDQSSVWFKPE